MNVIDINERIIQDYTEFITSFVTIDDTRIKEKVKEGISQNKLWKEPLIQFNPAYQTSESVEQLCNSGILQPELNDVFKNYNLFQHQTEALKKGVNDSSFIVTSGTGSGKSLTFIGTIFNHLFKTAWKQKEWGVKAIIVYPMNALINSQTEELNKFAGNYKKQTNKDFPFTFKQYTGQENEDERILIKNNPPDILLTNYMMLELILTRSAEQSMRNSIQKSLRYLVFDELHIYRGRQGSDVSLLVRRIKALAENKLVFIGTSATMASGKDQLNSKESVAGAVSVIFGQKFNKEDIITEKIKPTLIETGNDIDTSKLKDYVINGYAVCNEISLRSNILAKWIEANAAIQFIDGEVFRRKPLDLKTLSENLSGLTEVDIDICSGKIKELLMVTNQYNTGKLKTEEPILPFKLNQFISQSGSVKTTLEPSDIRYITLDDEIYHESDNEKLDLYTIVFNYYSGKDYLCVKKDLKGTKIVPRDFNDFNRNPSPDSKEGYIFFSNEIYDVNDYISYLPESWKKRDGSIADKYAERLPTPIYFDKFGNVFKNDDGTKYRAYFMEAPFIVEPFSGVFYSATERDRNKFTTLGTEGRSTSTDILVMEILNKLRDSKVKSEELKILSFVDNRQDASLQAGHFNDFIKKLRLRIALYKALTTTSKEYFTYADIADEVFNSLNLDISEYAKNPPQLPSLRRNIEKIFKMNLFYSLIQDLKLEWRIVLPNLERTGLLKIEYIGLEEDIPYRVHWNKLDFFKYFNDVELYNLIYQTLNYFRSNYALSHINLTEQERNTRKNEIQSQIIPFWGINKENDIDEPIAIYVKKSKEKYFNNNKASMGEMSAYGRYIKQIINEKKLEIKNISDLITDIFNSLTDAGYLISEVVKNSDSKVYYLDLTKVLWTKNKDEKIVADKIRRRSFKDTEIKPNEYFKQLYCIPYDYIKNLNSKEHTAQINNDSRKERESDFRSGKISLLSCSPTMELGIDISTLNIVHLRNVPPNPANYAQRAGRAGRSGQAALIYTFCGKYNEHDQHFYREPAEMVAGVVEPPRIDLFNEELIKTHLYAAALSYISFPSLNIGISDLINIHGEKLELREEVEENFNLLNEKRDLIISYFKKVIRDFEPELKMKKWYNDNWIDIKLNNIKTEFDKALDRWRNLFNDAKTQLAEANEVILNPLIKMKSKDGFNASSQQRNAKNQMELLQNIASEGKYTFNEFYPYRYLAAEGFLPGYNFTRLPIRAFVPSENGGEFLSRPRFLALKEFGPQSLIYHDGNKYRIYQMMSNDIEAKFKKLLIEESTGFAVESTNNSPNMSPFSGEILNHGHSNVYINLLQMNDSRTKLDSNISCLEEERTRKGYEIKTYFSYHGNQDEITTALIKYNNQELLKIKYMPATTIIKINEKWKSNLESTNGFYIDIKTGLYEKLPDSDSISNEMTGNLKLVKLYTDITSDALYIFPTKALGFNPSKEKEAIITLQFALKKAIEKYFKIESNEIEVLSMGDESFPNMFIYEAAEGSLGILSQIAENTNIFLNIVKTALEICHFKDGIDQRPDLKQASYYDLLSYSNQMHHRFIDRFLIKDQLETLLNCNVEIVTNSRFYDGDEQYLYLLNKYDKSSSTEKKFLDFLYANGYKLPDEAQPEIEELYIRPDFYYKETNTFVFCDGTPHDRFDIALDDKIKREELKKKGYDVFVYHYKDNLDEIINLRTDIFKKIK